MSNTDNDMVVEYDKYVIASKTDVNGIITYVSNAFADISGYKVEEMIGQPHNIVRHPDMPSSLYESIWKNIKNGKTWKGEIKNKKKYGGFYWVFANIAPIFNEKKEIVGFSSVRKDITAEKSLIEINKNLEIIVEQKVQESLQKDKLLVKQAKLASMGEMIDAIAHQWKNPLAIIDLFAQKIKLDLNKEVMRKDSIISMLEDTRVQVAHLVETLNEFRNFFRPNKFKQKVQIKSIIDSTLVLLSDELKTHRIKTSVSGDLELDILTNPNEFKHVLINLIQNSKDAFEENNIKSKMIQFNITNDQNNVVLEICDNAGGIGKGTIENIFKPHFTTKEEGKGTGIGLYLTRQIVEKNNAHIDVKSEGENTCFSIKFDIE